MRTRDLAATSDFAVVERLALELLGALLREAVGSFDRSRDSPDALRAAMLVTIDDLLDDPRLGIPKLAALHALSERSVHSLFACVGTTPARHIR